MIDNKNKNSATIDDAPTTGAPTVISYEFLPVIATPCSFNPDTITYLRVQAPVEMPHGVRVKENKIKNAQEESLVIKTLPNVVHSGKFLIAQLVWLLVSVASSYTKNWPIIPATIFTVFQYLLASLLLFTMCIYFPIPPSISVTGNQVTPAHTLPRFPFVRPRAIQNVHGCLVRRNGPQGSINTTHDVLAVGADGDVLGLIISGNLMFKHYAFVQQEIERFIRAKQQQEFECEEATANSSQQHDDLR